MSDIENIFMSNIMNGLNDLKQKSPPKKSITNEIETIIAYDGTIPFSHAWSIFETPTIDLKESCSVLLKNDIFSVIPEETNKFKRMISNINKLPDMDLSKVKSLLYDKWMIMSINKEEKLENSLKFALNFLLLYLVNYQNIISIKELKDVITLFNHPYQH